MFYHFFLLCQGSDKDKRKDGAEKEEKAKKVLFPSLLTIQYTSLSGLNIYVLNPSYVGDFVVVEH